MGLNPFCDLPLQFALFAVDRRRFRLEDLEQMLDLHVLQIARAQVFQNVGEFVEQQIFEMRKFADFVDPALPETVVANLLVKLANRVVQFGAPGGMDSTNHRAEKLRRPLVLNRVEVCVGFGKGIVLVGVIKHPVKVDI